jgi:TolB-like protein
MLEAIAEPGGVGISEDAQRQIRGKVEIACDDMGMQALKNMAEPMRAWRVRLGVSASTSTRPSTDTAQPLALPDRPSIAVLPFTNMSGDSEQDYFADGMAEDIITALSHFKALFVIARNSSFTQRGRTAGAMQLAADQHRARGELAAERVRQGKVLADLQVEKAGIEGERRKVEADLGPVRYLATLLGAGDQDVLRYFILVVALLLDPAAVLLLLAAASARRAA